MATREVDLSPQGLLQPEEIFVVQRSDIEGLSHLFRTSGNGSVQLLTGNTIRDIVNYQAKLQAQIRQLPYPIFLMVPGSRFQLFDADLKKILSGTSEICNHVTGMSIHWSDFVQRSMVLLPVIRELVSLCEAIQHHAYKAQQVYSLPFFSGRMKDEEEEIIRQLFIDDALAGLQSLKGDSVDLKAHSKRVSAGLREFENMARPQEGGLVDEMRYFNQESWITDMNLSNVEGVMGSNLQELKDILSPWIVSNPPSSYSRYGSKPNQIPQQSLMMSIVSAFPSLTEKFEKIESVWGAIDNDVSILVEDMAHRVNGSETGVAFKLSQRTILHKWERLGDEAMYLVRYAEADLHPLLTAAESTERAMQEEGRRLVSQMLEVDIPV